MDQERISIWRALYPQTDKEAPHFAFVLPIKNYTNTAVNWGDYLRG